MQQTVLVLVQFWSTALGLFRSRFAYSLLHTRQQLVPTPSSATQGSILHFPLLGGRGVVLSSISPSALHEITKSQTALPSSPNPTYLHPSTLAIPSLTLLLPKASSQSREHSYDPDHSTLSFYPARQASFRHQHFHITRPLRFARCLNTPLEFYTYLLPLLFPPPSILSPSLSSPSLSPFRDSNLRPPLTTPFVSFHLALIHWIPRQSTRILQARRRPVHVDP